MCAISLFSGTKNWCCWSAFPVFFVLQCLIFDKHSFIQYYSSILIMFFVNRTSCLCWWGVLRLRSRAPCNQCWSFSLEKCVYLLTYLYCVLHLCIPCGLLMVLIWYHHFSHSNSWIIAIFRAVNTNNALCATLMFISRQRNRCVFQLIDAFGGSGSVEPEVAYLDKILIAIGCGAFLMGYLQVYCWSSSGRQQAYAIRIAYFRSLMRQVMGAVICSYAIISLSEENGPSLVLMHHNMNCASGAILSV